MTAKIIAGWYYWIVYYLLRANVESLYLLGKSLLELYECVVIATFFCLTWLASKSIQLIIDDVESYSPVFRQASGHRVVEWSRGYCLIMNFVCEISCFFELMLFVFVLKVFVFFFIFLTSVEGVIDSEASHNSDLYIFQVVYIIKNGILFTLVIIGVQNMKKKAIQFNNNNKN